MSEPIVQAATRLLLAPTVVIAVALLAKSGSAVGDGFSAGVVASLGVALPYLAFGSRRADAALRIRYLPAATVAGLLAAVVLAFAPLVRGDPPLTHLPHPGESAVALGQLKLTTAFAFDVAIFALVVGAVVAVLRALARADEEEAEG